MQIKFLFLLTLLMLFSLKADGRQYINLQRILVAISSCKIPVVNHDKILPVGISFNFKCVVLIDDMFARKDSRQAVVWLTKKITNERSSRLHNTTLSGCETEPEKYSGFNGTGTHDLWDTNEEVIRMWCLNFFFLQLCNWNCAHHCNYLSFFYFPTAVSSIYIYSLS